MKSFLYSIGGMILGIILGVILINGIFTLYENYTIIEKSEYNSLIRSEDFYSNYLYKSGWSDGFGEYTLRSFDSGASWYAFDYDTLLGHVDSIHPGLLKHINAWDNITKFCKENGPINENNFKILELDLNEVGITIEEKETKKRI